LTAYLENLYKNKGIIWKDVGNIDDLPAYWNALVYNNTHHNDPLTRSPFSSPNHLAEFNLKSAFLDSIPVEEWFKDSFALLEEGFSGGKRVLVHCHAGVSRSAAVVAAYLIKKLRLPIWTILAGMRNFRVCVNPSFVPFLIDYGDKLEVPRRELPLTQ